MGLIQRTLRPRIERPAMIVFAGDHGIAKEDVSSYPQEVTAQMVAIFWREEPRSMRCRARSA
ncbi:MAG: Nicotinate-nucleotide--dimethylbenzimidazole phosphoribosyltransferase (EC [uncultured Caballeronia sp.]|nr:MAG: Nicotinate-nucleotide--dimethylbenzimidazole phosphoribosyltransferase (EC [uncultured Caballeronia sp.]